MDLGQILELYDLWNTSLPQVKIFYAVKCISDLIFLKTLAALGVGFDCATKVTKSCKTGHNKLANLPN